MALLFLLLRLLQLLLQALFFEGFLVEVTLHHFHLVVCRLLYGLHFSGHLCFKHSQL